MPTHIRQSSRHFNNANRIVRSCHLLEDLAVSPVILLAIDLDWLVPRPLVLNESLVLGLAGVQLGEFVAFPVGSDIESGKSLVTSNQEGTLDDGVVGNAVDRGSSEEILARCFETSKETT